MLFTIDPCYYNFKANLSAFLARWVSARVAEVGFCEKRAGYGAGLFISKAERVTPGLVPGQRGMGGVSSPDKSTKHTDHGHHGCRPMLLRRGFSGKLTWSHT